MIKNNSDMKNFKIIYITSQPNIMKAYISYSEPYCGIMSYQKNLLVDCLFRIPPLPHKMGRYFFSFIFSLKSLNIMWYGSKTYSSCRTILMS